MAGCSPLYLARLELTMPAMEAGTELVGRGAPIVVELRAASSSISSVEIHGQQTRSRLLPLPNARRHPAPAQGRVAAPLLKIRLPVRGVHMRWKGLRMKETPPTRVCSYQHMVIWGTDAGSIIVST
ncbi:hypothetical protein EJB05_52886 [Eragrostis curvula]|uniref:Uncharacterized protein n=1 Tax=Eragrostis curvula TaxID=38414 RepID=A0A5J9SRR8_9POAL|nr:hypothetical protein EJB05_52886 [Eragrostis curvula]